MRPPGSCRSQNRYFWRSDKIIGTENSEPPGGDSSGFRRARLLTKDMPCLQTIEYSVAFRRDRGRRLLRHHSIGSRGPGTAAAHLLR